MIRSLGDIPARFGALGGREAVRFCTEYRTTVLSYSGLDELIRRAVQGLRDQGLTRGDRFVLWAEACPPWVAAFWAGVALGLEVIPIDRNLSSAFVERVWKETRSRLLVYEPGLPLPPGGGRTIQVDQIVKFPASRFEPVECRPEDVAEILFTSGTTGTPKGVVHTHRTLSSNLNPIADEIARYRTLARPFQPVRILDLLPLSHLFGQAMGLFIPPLLGGAAVFVTSRNPARITQAIRREKVVVLVAVPRILALLRAHLDRCCPGSDLPVVMGRQPGTLRRLWVHRRFHRALGWRFWALVVGGATLGHEIERWWSEAGFVVIQGYGMTEAGPVIALNHPFRKKVGSLGKVLRGQEVRLAEDGEIQVRGDSVSRILFGGEADLESSGEWFHTGDLAKVDGDGNLYFLGRKKDLIVTAEGLNIYPEEVEAVLVGQHGIADSVVIAGQDAEGEFAHAVVIPARPDADVASAIRKANQRLEAHQRIRSWSVWKNADFPRTSAGMKVKRSDVAQATFGPLSLSTSPRAEVDELETGPVSSGLSVSKLQAILGLGTTGSMTPDARLEEDLGLSSLDRLQLLNELEEVTGESVDDGKFSSVRTVGELARIVESGEILAASPEAGLGLSISRPGWAGSYPVRLARRLFQDWLMVPLVRRLTRLEVCGETVSAQRPSEPLLIVANHQSHLDTPALLAALPPGIRRNLAPAMSWERFATVLTAADAGWRLRLSYRLQFWAASFLFNAFPLPQGAAATRSSLILMGKLIERGGSLLVFPEGRRSVSPGVQPFRPGAALVAVKMRLPVLPVLLTGTGEVLPPHQYRPVRGAVKVRFGRIFEVDPSTPLETAAAFLENEYWRQFSGWIGKCPTDRRA